jgi:antitoxin ChpS
MTMSMVKIRKVGGSLMLAVPSALAKQLGATEGDTVQLEVKGDQMIVRAQRKKYALAQLLKESPKSFDVDRDWDRAPAAGKELL